MGGDRANVRLYLECHIWSGVNVEHTSGHVGVPMIDVTIVLVNDGYASTGVGPMEVFYSAGQLWNVLEGHGAEPKFRISVASIDGRPVTSAYGLSINPQTSIEHIE